MPCRQRTANTSPTAVQHRVKTLRRTLRPAGRVDLCDIFLPTHATAAGKVAGAAAETVLKAATSSQAMSSSVSTQDNAARDALKGCVSEHDRRALRAGLRAARDAEPYLKAAHPALVSNSTLEPVHLSDSEWTVLTPPRKQEEVLHRRPLPEGAYVEHGSILNAHGRCAMQNSNPRTHASV